MYIIKYGFFLWKVFYLKSNVLGNLRVKLEVKYVGVDGLIMNLLRKLKVFYNFLRNFCYVYKNR